MRVSSSEAATGSGIAWNEPPADLEWNDWGPPVRVRVDPGPVAVFARAVKDHSRLYRSERAAHEAGFDRVPTPPTFTFVMSDSGAFPDLQPAEGTGSMYAAGGAGGDAFARDGLFLHGEQHFTYHRPVEVGDVLEGRLRTSKRWRARLDADRWKSPGSRRSGPRPTARPSSPSRSSRSSSRTAEARPSCSGSAPQELSPTFSPLPLTAYHFLMMP